VRRHALGDLLRTARARIAPETSGIPIRSKRRAPGLLSEEVAELIGVSATWYARFEAGQARMSIKALNRLAETLRLDGRERSQLLHLAVPELEQLSQHSTIASTRELQAFRRFHRRAESASSSRELVDMAVAAAKDGLPKAAFTGAMSRSASRDRWLHRSVLFPDVADQINQAPLDDKAIERSQFERDGLRFIGSPDYGSTWSACLRDRNLRTNLRAGFGVRIPDADCYLGYCVDKPGAAATDHILFLHGLASTVALIARGTSYIPDE
jgi:transcriptional regulator with XRE-family HTH domain